MASGGQRNEAVKDSPVGILNLDDDRKAGLETSAVHVNVEASAIGGLNVARFVKLMEYL
jgi:hypothetical protein